MDGWTLTPVSRTHKHHLRRLDRIAIAELEVQSERLPDVDWVVI